MTALDTHVVVWLHAGEIQRLPPGVRAMISDGELVISPIVLLELEYLHEVGRTACTGDRIFADLAAEIALTLCPHPFAAVVRESLKQAWTRDPFDRIIAAHAVVAGHCLLTKDESIRANCLAALWA